MNKQIGQLLERHFDIALETPDGVKKLRELILTLAMQGKLVKQDPKNQPASELLKLIEEEKKWLVKEGKIKKQEPISPILPTAGPYVVPNSWKWVYLTELFAAVTDGDHQPPPQSVSGIPFLVIGNLNTGKILLDGCRFVSNDYYNSLAWIKKPIENDLLYTVTGSYGIPVRVDIESEFCVQRHVAILKGTKSTPVDFITHVLSSSYAFGYATSIATGIAQKTVPLSGLRLFPIPLPPLAEQKRIVAKIDQLMTLCDKLESERNERSNKRLKIHTASINKLLSAPDKPEFDSSWNFITKNFSELYSVLENVEELKKAILQLAVMGKLVKQDPKDQPASELLKEIEAERKRLIKAGKIRNQDALPPIVEDRLPFELPNGWVWVRLGAIGETQTGTTPPKKDPSNEGKHIPFIGPGDISSFKIDYNNNGLSQSGLKNGRLIKKNSVLMVCIGGSIGKTAINEIDVTCNQQINTITPFLENSHQAVFYNVISPYFQRQILDLAGGSATPIINKQKWGSIPIPLPPAAEQKCIVTKIDQLMSLCNLLVQQVSNSTDKQTAILDAVLAQI